MCTCNHRVLTHHSPTVMNGSSHSPTAVHGAPSTPNGFSNGPATSSTASLSTQHLPPACGARQLSKLKRFLTTLQQFGSDISPEIGERVRTLVLGLVVSLQTIRHPCSPSGFCHRLHHDDHNPVVLCPALEPDLEPPPPPPRCGWDIQVHNAWEPLDGAVGLSAELNSDDRRVSCQAPGSHQLSTEAICHPLSEGKRRQRLPGNGTVYTEALGKEGKLLWNGWNPVREMGVQRIKNG